MLRGDEAGPIQTATILSNVASEYAPDFQSLISVTLGPNDALASEDIEPLIRQQLRGWFGDEVSQWNLLQTYRIPYGLPKTDIDPVLRTPTITGLENTYICGDHMETPSIEGAMNSGIRVADLILSARQTTS